MGKEDLTTTFCTVLKDFINDLYKSYPDTSLMMLQQAASTMILADPQGVVRDFMICVEPYLVQINERDEKLFLGGMIENDISGGEYSFLLDELKKISVIWADANTSTKTKNSIWKYLQILVKLGTSIEKK